MTKRYNIEDRYFPGDFCLPAEVSLEDGVTILRLDEGRRFGIRFTPGCELSDETVIDRATDFARAGRMRNAADDELCDVYVSEDFVDWALDQLAVGHSIPVVR